jgi:DNA-binding beta-propeller fold protein YncE
MTRTALVALSLLAIAATPASAASITQLEGKAGCVEYEGRDGCQRARGIEQVWGLATSPDGRHVYSASSGNLTKDGSVAIFSRDRKTGRLRQLSGKRGCIASVKRPKCATAPGLGQATQVTVSPDGRTVYTLSGWYSNAGVNVWRRDRQRGGLTLLECWVDGEPPAACRQAPFSLPDEFVLSQDGRRLYLGGDVLGSFVVQADGRLGAATCHYRTTAKAQGACEKAPQVPVRGALGAVGLEINPRGSALYASLGRSAVARLEVASGTGAVSFESCVDEAGAASPCGDARVVKSLQDLTLSPRGDTLYTASDHYVIDDEEDGLGHSRASAISVFGSGLRQAGGTAGCVLYNGSNDNPGCGTRPRQEGRPFTRASSVAIAPAGDFAVAGFFESSAVVLLSRGRRGRLELVTGERGCVSQGYRDGFGQFIRDKGCTKGHGMTFSEGGGPQRVAISPDGRNAYVSIYAGKIAAFRLKR